MPKIKDMLHPKRAHHALQLEAPTPPRRAQADAGGREEGGRVMNTTEEKVIYPGVKIGEFKARLDALLAQQLRGFGKVAKLDARLDGVGADLHTLEQQQGKLWADTITMVNSLAQRVNKMELATARRLDALLENQRQFAARLDALVDLKTRGEDNAQALL